MIQYDVLLDPSVDAILPRQALDTPPLQQVHWNTQSSGIQIPDAIVTPLETLWASFTPQLVVTTADEIADGAGLHEGATKRIAVNAFERNPLARQRCVAYYGPRCVICGFDFEQVYGEAGTGFMHVHHLVPLSEIGKDYQVDPVRDLRPVCPNCHAILHRRNPAYTIDEMRALVTSASVRH